MGLSISSICFYLIRYLFLFQCIHIGFFIFALNNIYEKFEWGFEVGFFIFIAVSVCTNFGRKVYEIYTRTYNNMTSLYKFKTIFDDLEESIVIICKHNQTVEYVNH